jgi:hypothetical protein
MKESKWLSQRLFDSKIFVHFYTLLLPPGLSAADKQSVQEDLFPLKDHLRGTSAMER